ncbi:HAD family hydrolase [Saccharothrix longispora]|uniref:HAD family hydrolase n=1 Tax=Saccharothrix longispora TaxID=33920 RepID=UPI0028FD950F|nr:HAD family hydrolase [Saccharothrix longispora]MBY8848588.1 HAD family hydrolase [Saccharothrix sp. MB29]MDU0290006.1 HAD family hydrolase [Saccharothrix longispora]
MERPALIASDVDGTLLGLDERVSPRTAGAVGRAIAAEVPFVLVTGRPPRWVPRVAAEAGTRGYAVCANGAVLYDLDRGEVVWSRTLDPVLLSSAAEALEGALPGCAFAVERVDDPEAAFVAEPAYRHAWPGSDHGVLSRAVVLGHPAVKLLVRHPEVTSGQLAGMAEALLGKDVSVTFSTDAGLIEIAAPGVTKATGLADVAERSGVSAEQVVAFGDMPNDVPMLTWAGHGVAMANAHPEALAAADEVTAPHTQDGVAQVLERWF